MAHSGPLSFSIMVDPMESEGMVTLEQEVENLNLYLDVDEDSRFLVEDLEFQRALAIGGGNPSIGVDEWAR